MSRFRLFLIVLISTLLIGGSIALWAAVSNDDDDVTVPISEVPAKVLDAANSRVPGGEITAVEMDVEDGVTIYDVIKVVDGVRYEIEVTADGVVNEVEKGDEDKDADKDDDGDKDEKIPLSDVPDIVLKAAKEAVPDGQITAVEKETEGGESIYEVDIVVKYEVQVKPNGEVIKAAKDSEQEDSDKEDSEEDDD